MVGALLTAAGLFSLLTGILETVRIYTLEPVVDPGLARLGLAAMIMGGLTTAAVGLGVVIGRGWPSLPRTVAVVGGWLVMWFPLTIAMGIATDAYLESQFAATALCATGIFVAVAAFARSRRRVSEAMGAAE